jgi:aminoglycoside phosphotransferase (APT) family kinase protein
MSDVVRTIAETEQLGRPPLLILEPLAAFLDRHGIGAGPIDAVPIGAGHSNVTYLLTRGDARIVLRRPPRPPFPPSAHDVVREARIQRALAGRARVPEVLAVCEEPGVIGAPFYLMAYVDGQVIGASLPHEIATKDRERIGHQLVDALVELHSVDPAEAGLAGLARPDGYLQRQVRRFAGLWEEGRTRDIPAIDDATAWLHDHMPQSPRATVVHGDYRLGNVMFHRRHGAIELRAILDWEMATLGDPLADLGYLTASWAEPADEENPILQLSAATRAPGFSSRRDLCERYAERSARSVAGLAWYEVLATWKAAIFLERSYRRYLAGTTDDEYFAGLADGVPALARAAGARIRAAEATPFRA